MLTTTIYNLLPRKTPLKKLLSIICRLSPWAFIFLVSPCIGAPSDELPALLPDATEITVPAATPTRIKTPEYVIIRSNDETMFSSETSGQIIYLPVKEGSSFNKGDTLLKLDCRLQQAELAKARAQQAATTKAMESAQKLKGYGSISEFEYIKTKSDADATNADVLRLQVTVEKCTVIAPFSGGVASVKVHMYETVKPGDPLIKVVNTENLTFEVQVPSQWLDWLKIGSTFSVHVNDIDKTIPAKITLINPEIEPISQTVKVVGLISPPNPLLRPGMTGQAMFNENPEKSKE